MREDNMRHVATICDDGNIRIIKEKVPELKNGMVLVNVRASLVSPGTELGGWKTIKNNRLNKNPLTSSKKFGYSNSGIITKVGSDVEQFKVGDRVACIGFGYALHTDWAVVPQNLCVKLPEKVNFEEGSYAMLLATAMQSVRRCQPELGERVLIIGLGLVGLLTARLHQLAGNYVIGWGRYPFQREIARKLGIDQTENSSDENLIRKTREFTKGYGLDAAVLAIAGASTPAWNQVCECMKKTTDGHLMGRVIMVGGGSIELKWIPANMDIRIAARTGPGYHDDAWEFGNAYPDVFMRWTTQTNLQLCMDLVSEGKINVDCLTTHRVNLLDCEEAVGKILDQDEEILGLIFVQ